MNRAQATKRLREMCEVAEARGERSIVGPLFGIKYADELADIPVAELAVIAHEATGHASYGGEIYKGRRIAKYVEWKEDS